MTPLVMADFVVANTFGDFVGAYLACQGRKRPFRCIHHGALAATVAVCGIDKTVLLASLAAAAASGKPLVAVADIALPKNAHILASGTVTIITASASGIHARRRFSTRSALIDEIGNACAAPGWVPGGGWHTAWADRGSRASKGGATPLVWPTGETAVTIDKIVKVHLEQATHTLQVARVDG